MGKELFSGVCTALVTPFLNGEVNYPMAEQLLRRQVDSGVNAVVVAGTTGESATLSDKEKLTLFKRCKDYIKDECTIIAGTGANSTEHTVWLSQEAEQAGADAILVVSPYYNKATPDGLVAHYAAVAHAVSIPVILYNVPSRTGVDIPVSVYNKLSAIPNIVGVKEASSDICKVTKIRRECPDAFHIWSGNDDQIVPAMALGAKGIVSVVSNICPAECVELCSAIESGDFKTAAIIQTTLSPLIDLLFSEVNPIPVKEAMKYIGFDCGGYRLPLCAPAPKTQEKIKIFFQ